ncbi:MAG TPA: class I SAM-dependent methyltransferase [Solirubrobacterales bacterium]|nr:class I SAM-dependent methyltransferase [Solirubrobacterales bacterium]
MLITEQFAWAHLPKAGGDATQEMLAAAPGPVRYASAPDSNDKHDPFARHEAEVAGKLRVMNIRRLPAWILSMAHHKATSGAWPDYEPQPLPSVEEMAASTEPDDTLRFMTDGSRFPVGRWLRQERLSEDVAALLADLGAPTDSARAAIAAVPHRANDYDHDLASMFSPEQVRRMYALNPAWAEIERRVYGDLHELARPPAPSPPPRSRRLAGALRSLLAHPATEPPDPSFAANEADVDGWLTSLRGPELEAIDRELAAVGPRLDNFALFRDLDDDVWALLLGRRYSTYLSILETLPLVPEPALQLRWNGAHGIALLNQSKAFYRHCKAMQDRHGSGPLGAARVLDFGCGWGRLTRFFARDVEPGALHGCDPVEKILEVCRRSRLPAVLHRSEFVPEELPVEGFDLAFSFSVFTHISEQAAASCLRALHRALNPGGLLVLTIRPPAYLDLDAKMHAARDALRPDPLSALAEPRYVFVPHDADPEHPQYEEGEMTYGEAVISLPYVRERWGELFELADVKIVTEDLYQVAITLRKR